MRCSLLFDRHLLISKPRYTSFGAPLRLVLRYSKFNMRLVLYDPGFRLQPCVALPLL